MMFVALAAVPCAAQPLIQVPPVETHRLESKAVGDSFEIRVMLPPLIPGENARFPVVYLTDASGALPVADDVLRLMMMSDVPRFIAVGVGYPAAKGFFQTFEIRQRDLTQVAGSTGRPLPIEGQVKAAIPNGGAAAFLSFIREELVPFIDARYPTRPADRTYFGHSLGGLFGLYTLFTSPATFSRYIIGSPSIWWGGEDLLKLAAEYIKTHDDLAATVFMGIGALEEGPGTRMVTNMLKLETMLRAPKYPRLQLTTRVFADEGHISVYPSNLIRGLVTVLGRPSPEEALLAKYRTILKPAPRH